MSNSQTAYGATGSDARPFLKPGWYPVNIGLMVLGFVVFWPLGLAMLAYNIWGHRLDDFKNDIKRQFSVQADWMSGNKPAPMQKTGNAAFDAYRAREMARLEEERSRIESMRQEFDNYMETLRQARDQEEFDRFMTRRRSDNKGTDGASHT